LSAVAIEMDGDPAITTGVDRRELMARGKAFRGPVPRSAHGRWSSDLRRRDPIAILNESHRARTAELVPVRVGRMMESPFRFFRGAAAVMASDLASTPNMGATVQLCGDAHLVNFRLYASPERNLMFDINDFDETLPGPWEWDIKRLAASIMVAARSIGFGDDLGAEAVRRATRSYREAMLGFAAWTHLEVWYARIDAALILRRLDDPDVRARAERIARKARKRTNEQAVAKLTELVDGRRRIVEDPPLITRISDEQLDRVSMMFGRYEDSLPGHLRNLLDRYEFVDAAHKVVGVGSVGTHCYVALFEGRTDGAPLFLQVKQAQASALERYLGPSEFNHHGERVVNGQRLMQAVSDVFLGWTRFHHRHYYVRQLRDMKGVVELEYASPASLADFSDACGIVLARAHARSGEPALIAGYLGQGTPFDEAMVQFATAYADQTERDHAALVQAVSDGRVPQPVVL
jgi:uncharacterized protein (DUF2252 family)